MYSRTEVGIGEKLGGGKGSSLGDVPWRAVLLLWLNVAHHPSSRLVLQMVNVDPGVV